MSSSDVHFYPSCFLLIGYGGRSIRAKGSILFVLPLFVSITFLLISDIDSPRRGLIHVPRKTF
jgi:hypothetical protein